MTPTTTTLETCMVALLKYGLVPKKGDKSTGHATRVRFLKKDPRKNNHRSHGFRLDFQEQLGKPEGSDRGLVCITRCPFSALGF